MMAKSRAEYFREYNKKSKVKSIRMNDDLIEDLKKLAKKQNKSFHGVVLHLIKLGLISFQKEKKKNVNIISRNTEFNYDSLEWKKFRTVVLKRDNFTCRICGKKPAKFAHHINTISYTPQMAFDLDNLITICKRCHDIWHERDKE